MSETEKKLNISAEDLMPRWAKKTSLDDSKSIDEKKVQKNLIGTNNKAKNYRNTNFDNFRKFNSDKRSNSNNIRDKFYKGGDRKNISSRQGQGSSQRGSRYSSGRDNNYRRNNRAYGRNREDRMPFIDLDHIYISVIAKKNATEVISKHIKKTLHSYPLKKLIVSILKDPSRHNIKLQIKDDEFNSKSKEKNIKDSKKDSNTQSTENQINPEDDTTNEQNKSKNEQNKEAPKLLIKSKLDNSIWLDKEQLINSIINSNKLNNFYTIYENETDGPKGNFQTISICPISKKPISPPNYHKYEEIVKNFHKQYASRMSIDVYRSKITTSREQEIIEEWKNENKVQKIYVPNREIDKIKKDDKKVSNKGQSDNLINNKEEESISDLKDITDTNKNNEQIDVNSNTENTQGEEKSGDDKVSNAIDQNKVTNNPNSEKTITEPLDNKKDEEKSNDDKIDNVKDEEESKDDKTESTNPDQTNNIVDDLKSKTDDPLVGNEDEIENHSEKQENHSDESVKKSNETIEKNTISEQIKFEDLPKDIIKFESVSQLMFDFKNNYIDDICDYVRSIIISGDKIKEKSQSQIYDYIVRYKNRVLNQKNPQSKSLTSKLFTKGLKIYVWKNKMTYVGPASLKPAPEINSLTDVIQQIVTHIEKKPGIKVLDLLLDFNLLKSKEDKQLLPASKTFLKDLKWLISSGYIIEFTDTTLFIAKPISKSAIPKKINKVNKNKNPKNNSKKNNNASSTDKQKNDSKKPEVSTES